MKRSFSYLLAVVWNLLLAMAVYTVCRLVFFRMNQPLFDVEPSRLFSLFRAGWRFDLSAVLFTNTPYLLLMLIPFRFREKKGYRLTAKGLYVVPNFLVYAIDLADGVYFPFTNRRTTCTVFQEFGGDTVNGNDDGNKGTEHRRCFVCRRFVVEHDGIAHVPVLYFAKYMHRRRLNA